MKLRAADFLVCPIDNTPLEVLIWEKKLNSLSEKDQIRINELRADASLFITEIVTGVLLNKKRKIFYPIYKGVPRMLTYSSGAALKFIKENKKRIDEVLPGYSLPELPVPEGELTVIKSFSKEWLDYEWNPDTYWKINASLMYKSMKFNLDIENKPVRNKLVLEVGIGIGGVADYFSSEEGCELAGIDLSYSVDAAYKSFGNNPFLHIIQASAFNLPFKPDTFDYIYSQGVLHHSSDPKKCFMNTAALVRPSAYFYVWLYNTSEAKRNLFRKMLMLIENTFRPLVWPLPSFLQNIVLSPVAFLYIMNQNVIMTKADKNLVKYSWREAIHAARDRFTPRYAFRYSEEEIISWYNEAGYENILLPSDREIPDYLTPDFYVATVIIGQKKSK